MKSQPEEFVIQNPKNFQEVYQLGPVIGEGAYGEVKVATHKLTNQQRAVKIYRKTLGPYDSYKSVRNEIEILKQLNHPSIIHMFEYFEDSYSFHLILEKCEGGELFYEISKKVKFSEQTAAIICKQLLSSILYLHENCIVHRDLKPENILLENKEDLNIKLIDFGTSVKLKSNQRLTEVIGSSYYLSPEVIAGSYDEKCDIWSIGVILFILLCGSPPFVGLNPADIMSKITIGRFSMTGKIWNSISEHAKDLIKRLLCPERYRLTAEGALKHPWIQSMGEFPKPPTEVIEEALKNLRSFHHMSKFKDAISTFITSQIISMNETRSLRSIFNSIDTNGDGKLSKEELAKGLNLTYQSPEDLEKLIEQVDTDGNGYIDYNEFIKASISQKNIYSKENMRQAFDLFDLDQSGKISSKELQKIFSLGNVQDSIWVEIVEKADQNLDGEIDFEEFCYFISSLSNS